jgi:hypothetical protein
VGRKKTAAAIAEPTELNELEEAKKELAHWQAFLKASGVTDDMQDHMYSETIANLEARIEKLQAK